MAHQTAHEFEMFKANVQDLLGEHPAHSVLEHLCREEMGGGSGVWIDGIDAENSDDATQTALTNKDTRMEFYQRDSVDQTFANYKLTKTPANDIYKTRTASAPELNEWGHYFDEDEGWKHLTDPKGKEVNVGVRKIFKGRDTMFANAVTAASVSRKVNDATAAAVTLPTSQALADLTYADFNIDNVPSKICEKFDDVWFAKGAPIYCCISSTTARHMRNNSRNLLHSNDFVRSYDNFATGNIPNIDGVTFVVVPKGFLSTIAGSAEDTYFAWTPDAICKVNYSPFKTTMGNSIDHRDDTVVYLREKVDYIRTDDKGVLVGDIIL